MTEQGAKEAAEHMAEYDKSKGVFDDSPCMGVTGTQEQAAYRAAYQRVNPPQQVTAQQ